MPQSSPILSRRRLFAGAGTAGALAVVASALPSLPPPPSTPSALRKPERGGGYHASARVQQYYQTARV